MPFVILLLPVHECCGHITRFNDIKLIPLRSSQGVMNRASGDDVGVAGAFPSQAYVASPFNFPQMISTLLPSLVASTSFPYATFFPTFLPFASIAMQPVFFNVTNVAGCSDDYRRDDILAVDAIMERSASTEESGLHDTSSSLLLGRRQKRVSPYRSADSASRVSLESCSGTGTTILNLPSAASSSALSSERILKRNCAWPDTQGSTNLGHAADVDMLTPEAESAIDAMSQASHASPFNTTAGLLATLPCTQTQLQPGFTGRPRSSPAQQQRGPTQALALVWEPCLGSHDRAAVTPQSVGLHGGGTALAPESTVAVPDDVGLDVDAQRRAGLNAHQQLPLRSSSGSLIWVGARRYGAILRRRRQREAQRSGLRVVSHACQQKVGRSKRVSAACIYTAVANADVIDMQ